MGYLLQGEARRWYDTHKHGTTPSDDRTLNSIQECGIIEEEFQRDKPSMKGSSQKKPNGSSGGNQSSQGQNQGQGKSGEKGKQKSRQGKAPTQNSASETSNAESSSQKGEKSTKKEKKDFSGLTKYCSILGSSSNEEYRPLHGNQTPKGSGQPGDGPAAPVQVYGMSLPARKK